MTQKDKQLLIQDLCARLPHWVKVETVLGRYGELVGIYKHDDGSYAFDVKEADGLTGIAGDVILKPYLRPMSSMTEEEREEYNALYYEAPVYRDNGNSWRDSRVLESLHIDWYNAHHFDFRNLIGRGLAIDCTGLNVY